MMQGEEMDWFHLANRLHLPVQLTKWLTTSKEFARWKIYARLEPNVFNPLFYYFAELIAEVAKGHSKGKATKREHRLIKFVLKKVAPKYDLKALAPEQREARNRASKAAWFKGLFGNPRGK